MFLHRINYGYDLLSRDEQAQKLESLPKVQLEFVMLTPHSLVLVVHVPVGARFFLPARLQFEFSSFCTCARTLLSCITIYIKLHLQVSLREDEDGNMHLKNLSVNVAASEEVSCGKVLYSYCNHALQIFFLRCMSITNFISHAEEIEIICNAFIRVRYFCNS